MKIEEMLKNLESKPHFMVFDRYDGLPTIYINKYDDENYFIYFWTDEDNNNNNKTCLTVYRACHLNAKQLKEISQKAKPLSHYYSNKLTYKVKSLYNKKEETTEITILKSITPDDECPIDFYVLKENIELLQKYIVQKQIKSF